MRKFCFLYQSQVTLILSVILVLALPIFAQFNLAGWILYAVAILALAYTLYVITMGKKCIHECSEHLLTIQNLTTPVWEAIPSKYGQNFFPFLNSVNETVKVLEEGKKDEREALGLLEKITEIVHFWSKGMLEHRIHYKVINNPYVGTFANTLNDFADQVDAFIRESSASMTAIGEDRYYRQFILTGLNGSFRAGATIINEGAQKAQEKGKTLSRVLENMDKNIRHTITSSLSETDQLKSLSDKLLNVLEQTAKSTSMALEKSDESRKYVESVVLSSKTLSESIDTLNKNVSNATSISLKMAQDSETARTVMNNLQEASERIGQITGLIGKIASKTDLLAVNASIEASRSGEGGKGFSVVAEEVKKLAGATVEATVDIAEQIDYVRQSVGESVLAIQKVNETVQRFQEISDQLSAEIEGQSSSAQHIASDILEITERARTVHDCIANLKTMADDSHLSAQNVYSISDNINGHIHFVQETIEQTMTAV